MLLDCEKRCWNSETESWLWLLKATLKWLNLMFILVLCLRCYFISHLTSCVCCGNVMLCLCTVQICFTLTWQPHILRLAVVAAIHTKEHVTLCFVLDNGIYCVHISLICLSQQRRRNQILPETEKTLTFYLLKLNMPHIFCHKCCYSTKPS